MKAIGSVIGAPLKAIGLIPKLGKPAPPPAPVTLSDASDAAAAKDEALRKRRGSGADIVTGAGGAEAGSTGKTSLG